MSTGYGELEARLHATAMARRIPLHATFCLTHRCNLDCVHCYLRDDRARAELPAERWCDLIDQAASLGALWLTLTGGEPTLRPDFAEIYRHAKRRGLLVVVMTNGTLLDEALLGLFAEWPPHYLDVTLYAFTAAGYRALTGQDRRDQVYATVEALQRRQIRLRLKTTVTRDNLDELPAIEAWARERGISYRVDGDLCPTLRGDRSVQDHRIPMNRLARLDLARWRAAPALLCGAGQCGFYVLPDGSTAACLLDEPVAAGDLATAWHGPLAMRREILTGTAAACAGCATLEFCRSCAPLVRLEGDALSRRCAVSRARQLLAEAPDAR